MKDKSQQNEDNKNERVLVYVRIRPFSQDELINDNSSPIESVDTKRNTMIVKKEYDKKNFNYDRIFQENINQKEVFEICGKGVVDSVLEGYNGTIFTYGQTGTGKTYTMVGQFEDNELKGIIPRSFDYMFKKISNNKDKNAKYNVFIAFIQIYLETIQDLFEPSNNVRIREDPEQGVFLEGVEWLKVKSTHDCEEAFKRGEKNRVTAFTKMNAHSSRSHAILIAKVEKSFSTDNDQQHIMNKSHLYLVDLAGSERVNKTNSKKMRLEEAKKINYSLLVLGNCIQSLTDLKSGHVSYRDSKLTRLLQESLGGNAKTSLIVTISPSSYNTEETLSSLNFGQRAMKVKNKPIINRTEDYQAQLFKLQEEYDKLTDEYSKLKIEYDKVVEENQKLKNGETFINLQRQSIERKLSSNDNNSNKDLKQELKKMEKFYEDIIRKKEVEYQTLLKEIDDTLVSKDNSIDLLKNKEQEYKLKIKNLTENLTDLTKEKEGMQNSLNQNLIKNKDLSEKNESLNSDIKEEIKKLTIKIKTKEEIEKNRTSKSTNTESLIDKELRENLLKLKISNNDIIKNKYDSILSQLLIIIESSQGGKENTIKALNKSINVIKEECENKINKNNSEMKNLKITIEELKQINQELQNKLNENNNNSLNYNNQKNNSKKLKNFENEKTKNVEENIKSNILSVIHKNISKFKPIIYNKNVDDLNNQIQNLSNMSEKMDFIDFLKNSFTIFENLIIRVSSFKNEKELEIENLNEKLIFLLRELDIYKKGANKKGNNNNNNENENNALLNQLKLKDEEIVRLNNTIQDYIVKIKELSNEINLYKSQKLFSNSNSYSKTNFDSDNNYQQEESLELEKKINECDIELNKINEKLEKRKKIDNNLNNENENKSIYSKKNKKK